MHQQRRIIAELHVASSRDERLGALLADWHRTWTNALIALQWADVDLDAGVLRIRRSRLLVDDAGALR